MYIYIYIYIHTHTHTLCVYVYMYIYIYIHTYAYIYIYIYCSEHPGLTEFATLLDTFEEIVRWTSGVRQVAPLEIPAISQ